MPTPRLRCLTAWIGALAVVVVLGGAAAQTALEPARGGGLATVDEVLARLSTQARVLVVGAHPDDEDNTLLAWVAAQGGDAAYLALSRGEGGQNLIGPELGVGLGLIRSEELLGARRLEGNQQFFTRAYDFGYSKTLTESLERWPREEILLDAVRVVRRFKPQVIVSIFRDGESPTHGQHQAAGVIAHAAYATAGDMAFDNVAGAALPAWQTQALYRRAWWRGEDAETIELPLGGLRPTDGQSWRQLAAASRSMHRSQDMGSLQRLGAGRTEVVWVAGGDGAAGDSLFSGIDTRLEALALLVEEPSARAQVTTLLAESAARAERARSTLSPVNLGAAVPELIAIRESLSSARDLALEVGGVAAAELIERKIALAERALLAAAGVVVDARSDRGAVAAAQSVEVTTQVWNSGDFQVRVLEAPGGGDETTLAAGELGEWTETVQVPADANPTVPYFLRRPRQGDLYDWSELEVAEWGAPFEQPPLSSALRLAVEGAELAVAREVVHVFADQASGEVRRPLQVVPSLEVEAAPPLVMRPDFGTGVTTVAVRLRSHAETALGGQVEVQVPAEWPAVEAVPFAIADAHGAAALEIGIAVPPDVAPGRYRLPVTATLATAETFGSAFPRTDYSHVRARSRPVPAAVDLVIVDLALPFGPIGWVLGASDVVPTALARLGAKIDLLSAAEVAEVDLSTYETVVIGSRAYETNPALGRANAKLLDYAREGGTLVLLYQQYQFSRGGFAPYAFEISRPHNRVTDEGAAVRVLDGEHAAFNHPNQLGPADWQGWVQERGLYFGGTWGPEFVPLLAMSDPGEDEALGSLLVAELGKGLYVYTGLSFFREIPAGVPGAYRLLANLLALKRALPLKP